jgi:hypothetical protein
MILKYDLLLIHLCMHEIYEYPFSLVHVYMIEKVPESVKN